MIDEKALTLAANAYCDAMGYDHRKIGRVLRERRDAGIKAAILAYESAKPKEAMEVGLSAYAQGVRLLSLVREIGATGFRNYPATYERAHTLVGAGLADYADPPQQGKAIWLKLTDAGRAMLSAAGDRT